MPRKIAAQSVLLIPQQIQSINELSVSSDMGMVVLTDGKGPKGHPPLFNLYINPDDAVRIGTAMIQEASKLKGKQKKT